MRGTKHLTSKGKKKKKTNKRNFKFPNRLSQLILANDLIGLSQLILANDFIGFLEIIFKAVFSKPWPRLRYGATNQVGRVMF